VTDTYYSIEATDVSLAYRMQIGRASTLKEHVVKRAKGTDRYRQLWALRGVSFRIQPGEVFGVVGPNGAGKSTLMKVLARVLPPSRGRVIVRGIVAPLIELGSGFNPELTAYENVILYGTFLQRDPAYMRERAPHIAEWAGLTEFMDVPTRTYSSGMQARLAFAVATDVKPEILLVDEVLSVGDQQFRVKSRERIQSLIQGGTSVVLVSHNLDVVARLADRALWLDHGEAIKIGPAEEVIESYAEEASPEELEGYEPADPSERADEAAGTPPDVAPVARATVTARAPAPVAAAVEGGRLVAVDSSDGRIRHRLLEAVAAGLGRDPETTVRVVVPPNGLPDGDTEGARLLASFRDTPEPLIDSWRVARHLESLTAPGDVVVLSDRRGIGAIFALAQAMRPPGQRRVIVVIATDSQLLQHLHIAGTYQGVGDRIEQTIDCELVAYRFAAAVAATSERAQAALADLGVTAQLCTPRSSLVGSFRPLPDTPTVWAPEPVSRLASTPAILRAVNRAREALPALRVFVSSEDRSDRIWSDTTWQSLGGLRAVMGDALHRREQADDPDVVVLGDPYAFPARPVEELRRAGVPVLVPEGSTAAARWRDAPTWRDEDELAELIGTKRVIRDTSVAKTPRTIQLPDATYDASRATRVSVAIPVFRNATYLDDAIASVLAQTEPVHELLLVDDGSRSERVDEVIDRWTEQRPDLVRALRQSNRGVCEARNAALDAMTGDAFLLLDQDDELATTFVERCADALRTAPEVSAVATWTEFFGEYVGIEAKLAFDERTGSRQNQIVSTCVLVDMSVRDAGLRFDPDLAWIFCEDWDYWAQIVAAGGRFGLITEPLARHRVHGTSGGFQRTPLAEGLGRARAVARFARKPPPPTGD